MGKVFDGIDDHLRGWIASQSLFFVGTAPLAAQGHVNVSPKGPVDTLAVLDPVNVAYLDLVGSGAETIAHLRENGRIVIMLCAFQGPPRIVRLHGRGTVLMATDEGFQELVTRCGFAEPEVPQARRAVVLVELSAGRRLVWIRSAADGVAGVSPASGRVGGQEAASGWAGGAPGVPAPEERRQLPAVELR